MKQGTISCVGRDGVTRLFSLQVEETGRGYELLAFLPGEEGSLNFVRLKLEWEPECNWLRVADMGRNNEKDMRLAERGIPDALLEYAGRQLGRRVVSSTNPEHDGGEFRLPAADKVWKRLAESGLA